MKPETIASLLVRAAHAHDPETAEHSERLMQIAEALAEAVGLGPGEVQDVRLAALTHDVGKNAVPDSILMKRGRLDDDERRLVSKHTIEGYELLRGVGHPSFDVAAQVALSHHETFNGSGYPYGKANLEIPIAARIVAVADVYDALRSARPYKAGLSHAETYQIITRGDGRTSPENFDPAVLHAFERRQSELMSIYVED